MLTTDPSVDKLTIETPEQTLLEYPLAGIGSRFLALALDTLIQWAAGVILGIALLIVASAFSFWQGSSSWIIALAIFYLFILQFGYFALFESIWNGQTPGKRATQLRVIQDSGRPITTYQAITRNLLRIIDSIPSFYGVGITSALISKQNKRLGDFVAGTVVVHEKPLEQVQVGWDPVANAAPASASTMYEVSRLSAEDLQLIENFLQRRAFLTLELRASLARQISDRLAGKIGGIAPDSRTAPEAFLEQLARERRSLAAFR